MILKIDMILGGRKMKKRLIIASVVLGIIGVIATGAANWFEMKNRGLIESLPTE